MCGIIGFINKPGSSNEHWNVKNIMETVFHWSSMGKDGIGFLVITDETYFTYKAHVSQKDFIVAWYEYFEELVNKPSTRAIIFHNRWATHGKVNSDGCHPFVGERYILIHNGSMPIHHIAKVDGWNYLCDSDTERMCAFLNSKERINMDAVENIQSLSKDLYNKADSLGIWVIYDTWNDNLYIVRSSERTFVYTEHENGGIASFWNNDKLSDKFAAPASKKALEHGSMLMVDPNDGVIEQTWNELLPKPKPKPVYTAFNYGSYIRDYKMGGIKKDKTIGGFNPEKFYGYMNRDNKKDKNGKHK